MLEKMNDFFKARLDGYDEHMLTEIKDAGFSKIEILHNRGATYCVKAMTR